MESLISPPGASPAPPTDARSTRMFAEAGEAPRVVERQLADNVAPLGDLARRVLALEPAMVFTCARGSSDHAATYAKYLFETHLGLPTLSHAPSISSIYNKVLPAMRGQIFLAISQSGHSPDLIASAELARKAGALVVALVNDIGSPLAHSADFVLPMLAGSETSVAATKSYIATLSALAQLANALRLDQALESAIRALPETLATAWSADWSAGEDLLAPVANLYVLGRGLTLGAAQEASLKFKETAGIHAEAFSIAEVAHGPIALVGPEFPVLVMPPSEGASAGLDDVLGRIAERSAPILVVGSASRPATTLPFGPASHPAVEPIAMIQSFYRMINAVAVRRGHDPDNPPLLRKVTQTL